MNRLSLARSHRKRSRYVVYGSDRRHIFGSGRTVKPMTDVRTESFLADVLALEGESPDAIREGVNVALADCEQIFKAQEVNKRMKDKAAHACHVLCRARIIEEMQRRKGTASEEHLRSVLRIIDGPHLPERDA
jgi:hypothetical protein